MKEKTSLKRWEKIFIISSISIITIIFFIYLFRLIHYYRIEHVKYKVNTLIQEVTTNVTSTGDGLYILDENNYYYKGINVSNYIWYSGNMYRIISVNDTNIKLISEDNLTTIAWGSESKFKDSYIYTWLDNTEDNNGIYLNSIFNYSVYLKEFNYCNSSINSNCLNKDTYLSSLLTRGEYLNAGGKLSYLNNESNYWIIDDTNEIEKAYVFREGGIGSEKDSISSYGVRPVITINGNITNFEGKGTKEEPYVIIDDIDNTLISKKIGEYVTYNDYTFRILSKEENGIKLILDGVLPDVGVNYNEAINYINNFKGKFSKLGTCTYYNGTYGSTTKYDYKNVYNNKVDSNIGLPSIGDLFLSTELSYWLYNGYDVNNSLNYKTNTSSTIIADNRNSYNALRPVLCVSKDLNVISGKGTVESPFVLGE